MYRNSPAIWNIRRIGIDSSRYALGGTFYLILPDFIQTITWYCSKLRTLQPVFTCCNDKDYSQTQEYIRSANTSATLSTLVPINPWQTVVVVQLKSTYQSPDAVNQSHSTYRNTAFTEIPTVNQCKFWSRCCQCL